MDVIVERCAGLDVHRDNVVATVRVPGSGRRPMGEADPDVQGDARRPRGTRSVAGGGRRDLGRDGGHRRVLEDGVPGARGSVRVLATVTRTTCATSPVARPTSRTPSGSASLSSTGWSARASYRQWRFGGCVISPGCAGRRPTSARARSSGSRKSSRTPGSNSRASPRTRTRSPPARCSKRSSRASRIPNNSPSSPRARCARRSRSYAKRSRAASESSTTGSWSPSCLRTSTRSISRCRT